MNGRVLCSSLARIFVALPTRRIRRVNQPPQSTHLRGDRRSGSTIQSPQSLRKESRLYGGSPKTRSISLKNLLDTDTTINGGKLGRPNGATPSSDGSLREKASLARRFCARCLRRWLPVTTQKQAAASGLAALIAGSTEQIVHRDVSLL